MFEKKHIIVGITGGIAVYKAAELVSQLAQQGADVHCIMTQNAAKFMSPITFGELSHNDVTVDMFSNITKWDVEHIALAQLADLFVIAPATANMIGKVASGIADDMLSTTIMATKAPVVFVPAMNSNMYDNPIVQDNMKKLRSYGYHFVEPDSGHLACNTTGKGRFPKLDKIFQVLEKVLYGRHLLEGKKVVISAGGTKEFIDPVRYIGNCSSGRMGYAIAKACYDEGADVTLVSCTDNLPDPYGIHVIHVNNARELKAAVDSHFEDSQICIMAAAVSDYRPEQEATQKIKKEDHDSLDIKLTTNPDILYGLGQMKKSQFLVGFAAETNNVIEHGEGKLKRKNLDMLVANDVSKPGAGFNVSTNIASLLFKDGSIQHYPMMSKEQLGRIIVEEIAKRLK